MAKTYTVEDDKGRQITFEWDGDGDPTDADYEEVFAAADVQPSDRFAGPDFLRRQGDTLPEQDDPFAGYKDPQYARDYFNIVDNYVRPIVKGTAGAVASAASVPLVAANPLLGLPAAAMGTGAAMTGVDSAIDLASGRPEGVREQADEFLINSAYSLGAPAMRGTTALRQFGANVVEGALSNAMGGNVERAATGQSGDFGTELYRTATDAATGGATAGVMTGAPAAIEGAARGAKKAAKFARHPVEESKKVIQAKLAKDSENTVSKAVTREGPIVNEVGKNLERTEQVAEKIGGHWNVGLGQASGDPGLLSLQRSVQMSDEAAKVRIAEQNITNLKAEEDYLRRSLPEGELGDALAAIQTKRAQLTKQAEDARAALEAKALDMEGMSKEDAGLALREHANATKSALKTEADELYGAVDRTYELDEAAVKTWQEGLEADRAAINEAFTDPARNPLGLLDRARAGLKEDAKAQFAVGDEVRPFTKDGKTYKGTVEKVLSSNDGAVTGYIVKTEKGPLKFGVEEVRPMPKVRAEAPIPVSLKRHELSEGMRVVDSEMGPGTITVDPQTMYRTFKADAGGQYSMPLGSGASGSTSLYVEGGHLPPPSYVHPNTAKPGARIIHPENGPGEIVNVHAESGTVQVKYDADGEVVNMTKNDRERTKYEQAPKPAEAAEATPLPTWKEFVSQRMGAYMKSEGGHAGAMKRIGAEWKEAKQKATAPQQAAAGGPKRNEPVTFGDLMDFRSNVVTKMREAKAASKFDLAQRLGKVLETVEATIAKAGEDPKGGETVAALRKANEFYRTKYVPAVRQGATGKILRTDGTGRTRVDDANVGRQYFKPGDNGIQAARDFKTTHGDDPVARKAIEDHAAGELMDAARDPQTGQVVPAKVRSWIAKHRPALKELGLEDKFGTMEGAMRAAEGAAAMAATFEKTRFAKAIDSSDPEKAIDTIFSGTNAKDTQATMRHLVNIVKDDKQALAGLKRAFGDFIYGKTRLSAENATSGERAASVAKMQQVFSQFDGAMEILYTPKEMEALQTLREAASIQARINQPTTGVPGSQTADLLNDLTAAGAARMLASPKLWAVKTLAGKMAKDWASAAKEYVGRALFDPRMAAKLRDINAMYRTDPNAADKVFKEEIRQTVSDTGPVQQENRIFNEIRTRVDSITDERMQSEIVKEMRAARAAGNLSPDQYADLMEKIAKTDPLTGIGNRLAWEDNTEAQAKPIHVVTDIDGFKFINDTFGHDAGDAVLQEKAKAMKAAEVGPFRLGGDEFMAGVENTAKVEKAREILRGTVFVGEIDGKPVKFWGVDFGYGAGKNKSEADAQLTERKAERNKGRVRGSRSEGLRIEGE